MNKQSTINSKRFVVYGDKLIDLEDLSAYEFGFYTKHEDIKQSSYTWGEIRELDLWIVVDSYAESFGGSCGITPNPDYSTHVELSNGLYSKAYIDEYTIN